MSKHHNLPTSVDTVAWGFFDAAHTPALTIESGDTVTVDTLPAGDVKELPADASRIRPDHRLLLDKAVRGNGPHPVNGPIYVKGAEPGDVLQIDILDIKPNQDWGFVAIQPLLGTLPEEFTDYETVIVDIDAAQNVAHLPWGTSLKSGAVLRHPGGGAASRMGAAEHDRAARFRRKHGQQGARRRHHAISAGVQ